MIVRVDIEPGTTLTEEMISLKRLGTGIFPADLERVIGQTAKLKILAEQIITWDMVDDTSLIGIRLKIRPRQRAILFLV